MSSRAQGSARAGEKKSPISPRSCSRDGANFGQVRENSVWVPRLVPTCESTAHLFNLLAFCCATTPGYLYHPLAGAVPPGCANAKPKVPGRLPPPSNVICLRFINESINEVPVRTDVRECAINIWYVNTARHALRFIITRGTSWPSRRIETRSF